jgi:hypothetical protein
VRPCFVFSQDPSFRIESTRRSTALERKCSADAAEGDRAPGLVGHTLEKAMIYQVNQGARHDLHGSCRMSSGSLLVKLLGIPPSDKPCPLPKYRTPCHPNNEPKPRRGFANRPGGEIPVLSKTHVMLGGGSALLMSSSASEKDPPAAESGDLEDMEDQPHREAQRPCRPARRPSQKEVPATFLPGF